MDHPSTERLLFEDIQGKKISADFDGGQVSSDAGALLLREVESRMRLIGRVAEAIPERRHPGYTRHSLREMISQRVYQIACGYEDADDADRLRFDPILKMACKRLPDDEALASQPTLSRLENSVTRTDLYRIADALVEAFIDSHGTPPAGILLDIDDTDDTAHGHQQLALFNAYYDESCYMPIHVYEGRTGKLITTVLRPGKRPSGREIVAILRRIVRKIRHAWPEVGILLRADAHYAAPEVFDFCRENDLSFLLGLPPNPALQRQAAALIETAERRFQREGTRVREFGEFRYQARSWTAAERIVVKAERSGFGPNTRFIVTNLTPLTPRALYEKLYSDRGSMELLIKDHKTHLRSDRTSCHRFEANQFRLFLHSMAYILMHSLRARHLRATPWARAQFDTIRLQVLKIGARVRQLRTRVRMHLPTSYPWPEAWRAALASCRASP